jgi:flavin-dependent dehydrogenase
VTADPDVIVVGGGPAGTATAIALARRGRRVVVLESGRYEEPRIGETLPPRARAALQELGVWDDFLRDGHRRSPATVAVWGDGEPREAPSILDPHGPGWHLDRRRFDAMLARAAERFGASLHRGARALAGRRDPQGGWRVEVAGSGGRGFLPSRWLVDAGGRASTVARSEGVGRTTHDRLVGLVRFLDAAAPRPDDRTLVEAVEDGWWYSALLPSSAGPGASGPLRVVAAYMSDGDLLPSGRREMEAHWRRRMEEARMTRGRVPAGPGDSELMLVPASTFCIDPAAGDHWLAVGDAAAAYDPLSSHGILKALRSGLRAAAALEEGGAGLVEYARWCARGFERYLWMRRQHYRREGRWPASTFWRRRGDYARGPVPRRSASTASNV